MPRPAILIIDLLNDFLNQWSASDRVQLIEATNTLVSAFRRHSLPVIWVRQEFEPDLSDAFLEMRKKGISITIKGTEGAEIDADLHRHASDPVTLKKRYSAFFRTDLDKLLERLRVDTVMICGINTHACIRAAAIDAYQRDLEVIIARDCVGSHDPEHGEFSLKYMSGRIADVLNNQEIIARLDGDAT
jgi:nicotinamidase-related amidase